MGRINATLAFVTVIMAGVVVFQRSFSDSRSKRSPSLAAKSVTARVSERRIVASGWIEGRTASIELGSRISEQIKRILAHQGDWVKAGTPLIELNSSLYIFQQQLAQAQVDQMEAELKRIQNGPLASEIEEARQEYLALAAELQGAQKNLLRLEQLTDSFVVSPQSYDEESSRVCVLQGRVAAAQSRLTTIMNSPREDELLIARAGLEAARSRLLLATENLSRTVITSPVDGRVLRVNCEEGELTGPELSQPLMLLSDTRTLRALAEVDEYDALSIQAGQRALIVSNQPPYVRIRGVVAELEPQVDRKTAFTNRPEERLDTFSRRVWIQLDSQTELPVGLPVDVVIAVGSPAEFEHSAQDETTARVNQMHEYSR